MVLGQYRALQLIELILQNTHERWATTYVKCVAYGKLSTNVFTKPDGMEVREKSNESGVYIVVEL